MKRFVTYLYAYENGVKTKSTGFIRVDIRGIFVNVEICIRKFLHGGEIGSVYLLVPVHGLKGILVGDIKISEGQGDLRLQLSAEHLQDTDFSIEDVVGVGICFSNAYLASCWVDVYASEIGNGSFVNHSQKLVSSTKNEERIVLEKEVQLQTPLCEEAELKELQVQTPPCEEADERFLEEAKQPSPEIAVAEKLLSKSSVDDVSVQSTAVNEKSGEDTSVQSAAVNEKSGEDISLQSAVVNKKSIQEKFKQNIAGSASSSFTEKRYSYRKTDLTHMQEIPQQDRHYGNNAFLIHGFWNYGYLILKTEMEGNEKKTFLGIPGLYERQEAAMAMAFGFPKFETIPEEISRQPLLKEYIVLQNENEKNQHPKERSFGCWFRKLNT